MAHSHILVGADASVAKRPLIPEEKREPAGNILFSLVERPSAPARSFEA